MTDAMQRPEVKEKMAAAMGEDYRARISEKLMGHGISGETRKKMSKRAKARLRRKYGPRSEEVRARISVATRAAMQRPEVKENLKARGT